MTTKELALAAAPELAVPLEGAYALARKLRRRSDQVDAVIQPPEKEPLIRLGRDRISVRVVKGVRVVQVHRAPGISAAEAIAIVAIGGTAIAAYSAYSALSKETGSLWGAGGILPGPSGWGVIKW